MRRMIALAALLIGVVAAQADLPPRVLCFPWYADQCTLDRLNLDCMWHLKFPVESHRDGFASIQHMGDQILVQLRSGSISAVDAETGAIDWTAFVGSQPYPVRPPLGFCEDLVFACDGTKVVALNRNDGTKRWEVELNEIPTAAPSAGRLLLYVPLHSGRVATYSRPTFTTKAIGASQENRAKISDAFRKIRSQAADIAPVVTDTRIPINATIGGRGNSEAEINARTGMSSGVTSAQRFVLHDFTKEEQARAAARPLFLSIRSPGFNVDNPLQPIPNGVLVSGSMGGTLALRLDPRANVSHFKYETQLATAPVVSGTTAYVSTQESEVKALALANGYVEWRWRGRSVVASPPILSGDSLFVSTILHGVYRIDRATGLQVWGNESAKQLLAANDRFVYTVDRMGKMQVLDRAQGTELSGLDVLDFNVRMTNQRTDRIIMAAHDGTLVSLRDYGAAKPIDWNPPWINPLPQILKEGTAAPPARN